MISIFFMALAFLFFLGNPKLLFKTIAFLMESLAWLIVLGGLIIMIAMLIG